VAASPSTTAGGGAAEDLVWRFPDRATAPVGAAIDAYLRGAAAPSADPLANARVMHLLFAANRWERAAELRAAVDAGFTVVLDRYAYSGVAYSRALGLDADWCFAPDSGLPKPDVLLFLNVSAHVAQARGGFGEERYETDAMQRRVRHSFAELLDAPRMRKQCVEHIDADGDVDAVHARIKQLVRGAVDRAASGEFPLDVLW